VSARFFLDSHLWLGAGRDYAVIKDWLSIRLIRGKLKASAGPPGTGIGVVGVCPAPRSQPGFVQEVCCVGRSCL